MTVTVASHAIFIPIAVMISTKPVPIKHVCILYTKLTPCCCCVVSVWSVCLSVFYQCLNIKYLCNANNIFLFLSWFCDDSLGKFLMVNTYNNICNIRISFNFK